MNNVKLHCVNGIIDNDCTICDEYKNGEHFNGVVIEKNSITYYIEAPIDVSYTGNFVTAIGLKGVRVSLDFRQSNYGSAKELAQAIINCAGDETTSSIQSKRPLKTVEGQSLEGSGNIDILEENIFGTLLEANVSGTYAIDFNAFADARLTMTADTTFTIDDILNNSQVMIRGIKLTGQYVPTLPGTQVNSEVYDGANWNRIIFDVNKLSNGTVEVFYTIEVI